MGSLPPRLRRAHSEGLSTLPRHAVAVLRYAVALRVSDHALYRAEHQNRVCHHVLRVVVHIAQNHPHLLPLRSSQESLITSLISRASALLPYGLLMPSPSKSSLSAVPTRSEEHTTEL